MRAHRSTADRGRQGRHKGRGDETARAPYNRAVARAEVTSDTPPPQPPIAVNLALETAMTHITFPTTAGWLYKLQWTDGPGSTWLEFPMERRGNGEDWTFQVPVEDGVPIRFFRVVAYP